MADRIKGLATKDDEAQKEAPEVSEKAEGLTEEEHRANREAYLRAWPLGAEEKR